MPENTKNQTILYVFTGSDWCPNCIKFKRNVLNDTLFQTKMNAQSVSIEILDFPQRKKLDPEVVNYNKRKAEKFEFDGTFPTLVLYSESNDKYSKFYYHNQNPEDFFLFLEAELNKLHD